MIAALYVATNGVYFGLPDVDPWDEKRDARLYEGPWPVVAHPPCSRWCRLAGFVEARGGRARGADDGCFAAALASVRKFGGVLEHPEGSAAWSTYGLPDPPVNGWPRGLCGGWSTRVEQLEYGHRARKPTWLYAVVPVPPVLRWGRAAVGSGEVKMCSLLGRDRQPRRDAFKPAIPKSQRSRTPLPFRDILLEMARSVPLRQAA